MDQEKINQEQREPDEVYGMGFGIRCPIAGNASARPERKCRPLERFEFFDDDRLGKAGFGPFLESR